MAARDPVADLVKKLRLRDEVSDREVGVLRSAIAEVQKFPTGKTLVRIGATVTQSTLLIDGLVSDAHELGLRVVVDLVPNHTSDQHEWFQAALAAGPGSPERARYLFRDGHGTPENPIGFKDKSQLVTRPDDTGTQQAAVYYPGPVHEPYIAADTVMRELTFLPLIVGAVLGIMLGADIVPERHRHIGGRGVAQRIELEAVGEGPLGISDRRHAELRPGRLGVERGRGGVAAGHGAELLRLPRELSEGQHAADRHALGVTDLGGRTVTATDVTIPTRADAPSCPVPAPATPRGTAVGRSRRTRGDNSSPRT